MIKFQVTVIFFIRCERSDPDFVLLEDQQNYDDINLTLSLEKKDRTFLVFESQLNELLKYCLKCGGNLNEMANNLKNSALEASETRLYFQNAHSLSLFRKY